MEKKFARVQKIVIVYISKKRENNAIKTDVFYDRAVQHHSTTNLIRSGCDCVGTLTTHQKKLTDCFVLYSS